MASNRKLKKAILDLNNSVSDDLGFERLTFSKINKVYKEIKDNNMKKEHTIKCHKRWLKDEKFRRTN